MEATDLRNLLRSFCTDSQWNYAVFWKLRGENHLILTWEEGYLDHLKRRRAVENVSEGSYWIDAAEINPLRFETFVDDGFLAELPIEQIVANTSDLQYSFGQGIVGEVACTGVHCWFLYDDILSGDFCSKMVNECPSEWLLQLASGIKTIVLVPVLPHGVLQFGSLEMVAEELCFVSFIQNLFALHREYGVDALKLEKAFISTEERIELDAHIQEAFQVREDRLETCIPAGGESMGVLPLNGASSPLSTSSDPPLHMIHNLSEICLHNNFDVDTSKFMGESITAHHDGNSVEALFGSTNENDAANDSLESVLWVAKDCELYRALTPTFRRDNNHSLWNASNFMDQVSNDPSMTDDRNLFDVMESFLGAKDADHHNADSLLEAVVSNVYHGSYDYNSQIPIESSRSLSHKSQSQSKCALVEQETVLPNHLPSASDNQEKSNSTASVSFQNLESSVAPTDRMKSNRQPKKGQKLSGIRKRKLGPCTSKKPRPRDRQLMQVRVKELRELVPNGGKCSIDGLLEQTIRHMQYLQCVTDQAAKLKKWACQEEYGQRSSSSSEIKSSHRNGTKCGPQSGNSFSCCPIFVKDLAQPGHMLIEMPCDEPSLLVDIVLMIRNLGLAIVKGSLETHEDNKWAHFIVEAKKGFQKLDIFWPLMQLWQRQSSER